MLDLGPNEHAVEYLLFVLGNVVFEKIQDLLDVRLGNEGRASDIGHVLMQQVFRPSLYCRHAESGDG